MASGLRKVRIPKNNLPPVIKLDTDTFGYLTRYRTVSEDRNRFSAWSNVYEVPVFDNNNLPSVVDMDIAVTGQAITVVWDDEEERPSYDIFVSENGGPFVYHGTSPIHTYSFLNKNGATSLAVAIQVESINKQRETVLTIAEQSVTIGP